MHFDPRDKIKKLMKLMDEYLTATILDIIQLLISYLKRDISETGFFLRLQNVVFKLKAAIWQYE
jgi:hypothetical protein